MDPVSAVEAVGALAGMLTTISFLPQVIKTWRTRSSEGVSMTMWLIFGTGIVLWLLHGVLIGSWPVIAANAVTLALVAAVVALLMRERLRGRRRQ